MSSATITGNAAIKLGGLNIDSGMSLDVGAAHVAIAYTGSSTIQAVEAQIRGGTIHSNGTSPSLALGIAEATETPFAVSWFGLPVDETMLLLRLTLRGDADLSGTVNPDNMPRPMRSAKMRLA